MTDDITKLIGLICENGHHRLTKPEIDLLIPIAERLIGKTINHGRYHLGDAQLPSLKEVCAQLLKQTAPYQNATFKFAGLDFLLTVGGFSMVHRSFHINLRHSEISLSATYDYKTNRIYSIQFENSHLTPRSALKLIRKIRKFDKANFNCPVASATYCSKSVALAMIDHGYLAIRRSNGQYFTDDSGAKFFTGRVFGYYRKKNLVDPIQTTAMSPTQFVASVVEGNGITHPEFEKFYVASRGNSRKNIRMVSRSIPRVFTDEAEAEKHYEYPVIEIPYGVGNRKPNTIPKHRVMFSHIGGKDVRLYTSVKNETTGMSFDLHVNTPVNRLYNPDGKEFINEFFRIEPTARMNRVTIGKPDRKDWGSTFVWMADNAPDEWTIADMTLNGDGDLTMWMTPEVETIFKVTQ